MLGRLWPAAGGDSSWLGQIQFDGAGELRSAFSVTDFAAAAVAAAGLATSELAYRLDGVRRGVKVDRGLAALWFGASFQPVGWQPPPPWDPIAGDYACADGWIRLHTNAPHHKAAALRVLGTAEDKAAVTAEVRLWAGDELEAEIVNDGGCASVMRSTVEWAIHPQGSAVALEPLIHWQDGDAVTGKAGRERAWAGRWTGGETAARPLAGLRVLDLTRVIAGPVATRFLAGLGAEVLRIDPPGWTETGVEQETTLGKTCAELDLKTPEGRRQLHGLLAGADVLVHGYRPGALEGLGLDSAQLQQLRPGLVQAGLDAYGFTGPWAGRRGFDSLVQMSCGIADEGKVYFASDRPHPLPVQALDHATGYLLAAAILRQLARSLDGDVVRSRLSLARTAVELMRTPPSDPAAAPPDAAAYASTPEQTAWGAGRRLVPPLSLEGVRIFWAKAASPLGSAAPGWQG